jgi:agmatine deiminase
MKKILLFSLLFHLISTNILAQDLPRYMTEEEIKLGLDYNPFIYPEFTSPPPVPVRTMAEWEELQGIMITWTNYTTILRQIVQYAQTEGLVYIVCSDSNSVKTFLTQGGVPLINLKFLIIPYNSVWSRDYGPWTVYSEDYDSLYIIDWIYNRPTRPLDDNIPVHFANYINVPIYQTTTPPNDLIHSGGNFMTDGLGTGFSSKLILNENSGKTEAQIDAIMNSFMGINRYIKMENLPNDVIHHIDMHMKLLDEETLLVGQYPAGVSDGPQIEANLQYVLNNFLTPYGKPYRVVRIPMPPHNGQYPPEGQYWTYTNSIIINKTVIIPTYQFQYDTTAFRIYREAMPGYRIVGINSTSMISALGAIHCIVKEIGTFDPLFISHSRMRDTVGPGPYEIKAIVRNQSGIANANVFWTNDTSLGYTSIPMTVLSGDTMVGYIPFQQDGTEVFYYINATSNSGKTINKPMPAPDGYYHFVVDNDIPVELISFNASVNRNSVLLEWATASETNNFGFEVQRLQDYPNGSLRDKITKLQNWEKVGFVDGNGTTTQSQFYNFTDKDLTPGSYKYRLKQIDFDGSYEYSSEIEVEVLAPGSFALEQNYPNPFNPSSVITYQLPVSSDVTLKVYDILGNEIVTLVDEYKQAGKYKVEFNPVSGNRNLASGIYFYQLKVDSFIETKKMLLMK